MNTVIEWANGLAIHWAGRMWPVLWQTAVLAAIVGVIVLSVRRMSPALRFWLWMLVPLRLLVMPLIAISLPVLAPPPAAQPELTAAPPSFASAAEVIAMPAPPTAAQILPPEPPAAPPQRHARVDTWTWLMAGWAVGIGFFSLRLARGWLRMREIARQAHENSDARVRDCAREAAAMLGLRKIPRIMSAAEGVSPFVLGFVRPVVVLPAALSDHVSPEELRTVLAHEFAHVRRRDALTGWVLAFCDTIYFFNPVVHFVRSRIMFERERACDEQVLALAQAPRAVYARALLSATGLNRPATTGLSCAPVLLESSRHLERRLKSIAAETRPRAALSRKVKLALLAIAFLAVPGFTLTARSAPTEKPKEIVGEPLPSPDYWTVRVSLASPALREAPVREAAVQFAIFETDPIPQFKSRLASLGNRLAGLFEEAKKEQNYSKLAVLRIGVFSRVWDNGFKDVAGDMIRVLTPRPGEDNSVTERMTGGRKWVTTKAVELNGKAKCWCIPIEATAGKTIEVTLTEKNALDLGPIFDEVFPQGALPAPTEKVKGSPSVEEERLEKFLDRKIKGIALPGATLGEAVELLKAQVGKDVNFIIDPNPALRLSDVIVTLDLKDVTMRQVLTAMLWPRGLDFVIWNNAVFISTAEGCRRVKSGPLTSTSSAATEKPKDNAPPAAPTEKAKGPASPEDQRWEKFLDQKTKAIQLPGVTLPEAIEILKTQFGSGTNFILDPNPALHVSDVMITLDLKDVTLRQLLTAMLWPKGLDFVIWNNAVFISTEEGCRRVKSGPLTYLSPTATETRAAPMVNGTEGALSRKVNLFGPIYPVTYPNAPTDKLSVQYAVIEIAKQAGLQYNWDKSYKNTDPVCRQWVRPDIHDQTCRDALQQLLDPIGLSYEVVNGEVILQKRKGARAAPAEKSSGDDAVMKQCDRNLGLIMKAIISYQSQNNDKLPPSLADLVPKYLDNPRVLICPADQSPMKIKNGLLCSHRYIGNAPWRGLKVGLLLAYDHSEHDGGRNVAFYDGQVKHLSEQVFRKSLAALYEELKPLMAKADFPGDRDRVKAFCEDKDFADPAAPAESATEETQGKGSVTIVTTVSPPAQGAPAIEVSCVVARMPVTKFNDFLRAEKITLQQPMKETSNPIMALLPEAAAVTLLRQSFSDKDSIVICEPKILTNADGKRQEIAVSTSISRKGYDPEVKDGQVVMKEAVKPYPLNGFNFSVSLTLDPSGSTISCRYELELTEELLTGRMRRTGEIPAVGRSKVAGDATIPMSECLLVLLPTTTEKEMKPEKSLLDFVVIRCRPKPTSSNESPAIRPEGSGK